MKARITLPSLFQLLVILALIMLSSLPLGAVQAEEDGWEFSASVQVRNNNTGYVEINGVDTRGPGIPFTFDWGDGTIEESWFIAKHTFLDKSRDYEVKITSHYDDVTPPITVDVNFSDSQEYELKAWVDDIQLVTGYVRVNGFFEGGDGLLAINWGDGETTQALFPSPHRYADASHNYTVSISGLYSNGQDASVEVLVDFEHQEYYPGFEVWTTLQPYRIRGFGWPFGKQVTLTVTNQDGTEEYLRDTLSPIPAPWNNDEPIIDYEVSEGLLLAGRRVTLDDGVKPKELIISDVAVTLVNVFTDRVDGTATPGTRIETWFCVEDGARCATRWMVTGDDGRWLADFGHPLGTGVPEEDETIEITPYYYSTVNVRDEDGDVTVVHWVGIMPIIEAQVSENAIWSYDWPTDGDVTMTIQDGETGELYKDTLPLTHPEWDPGMYVAWFELSNFQLAPGQIVTLRNSIMEKELVIADVSVTNVDVVADTVAGTAAPDTHVEIPNYCVDAGALCATRRMIANEYGGWFADFSQPAGTGIPDEEVTVDILPYVMSTAQVRDNDGDVTVIHWYGQAPIGGESVASGWINSPVGAYSLNPSAAGKAVFNFTAKYPKKSSAPTGKIEFQFKAGNINFVSKEYNWLVIAGSKVQFRGMGTLNGKGNYWFLLTAFDNGSGGQKDQLRFQIFDDSTGELIYDTLRDPIGNAFPRIGGGDIVIHTAN